MQIKRAYRLPFERRPIRWPVSYTPPKAIRGIHDCLFELAQGDTETLLELAYGTWFQRGKPPSKFFLADAQSILLDSGIRVDELARLTLDDVHEGYLKIQGKGRKEREVGISPTTAKFLWKYVNLHRAAEGETVRALFTSIRGRSLTVSGIEQIFDRIREVAGITDVDVTPHKLRHTFARTWLERGGDIYSLSRLMGHSSVKITEIYLEDFKSRQARAQHTQFSPVGKMRLRQKGRGRHTYHRGPCTGGTGGGGPSRPREGEDGE